MYDYLLFDLDGTLTDPQEGITKCVQHGLSALGIQETNQDILTSFIGPPLEESFSGIYQLTPEQTTQAIFHFRERFRTVGLFENHVFDGIPEMLAKLAPYKKIALATSKPQVFAIQILEKYGLLPYFDVVVGSNLDGTNTHKHEVIALALKQLKIPSSQHASVLMIGDRKYDVDGAKVFDIDCLGVTFGYARPGELEAANAKYIVSTVLELEDFLLNC